MMRAALKQDFEHTGAGRHVDSKGLFRARFRRALRSSVRRRFSVAECFGVVWLETLEEVPLTDDEQADLYDELIYWAKHQLLSEILQTQHSRHPASKSR